MNEWNKGHCNQDIRVLIKFQSGEIKIAKWVGSTDVCNYNSWQTDKGYWYPAEGAVMTGDRHKPLNTFMRWVNGFDE